MNEQPDSSDPKFDLSESEFDSRADSGSTIRFDPSRPPQSLYDQIVGQRIGTQGHYEIRELLQRGGMSLLYYGWHRELDGPVALKTPHPLLSEDARALLTREARAQFRVHDHPKVVRIYDALTVEILGSSFHFLVFEWINGRNAKEVINSIEETLLPSVVCSIMSQACDAVDFAHDSGIVHGDIKPSNLMLATDEKLLDMPEYLVAETLIRDVDVRLTDFGLASSLRVSGRSAPTFDLSKRLVRGTPAYAPPEIYEGAEASPKTDVYSMGATFYELTTGLPPFRGQASSQVMQKHRDYRRPRLSKRIKIGTARATRLADDLVETSMAIDPRNRFDSVEEMADEFRRLQSALNPWWRWGKSKKGWHRR